MNRISSLVTIVRTVAYVDIDASCKGQEFTVHHKPCFITGNPITLVSGMGLSSSYTGTVDVAEAITKLLSTVDCVPMAIRVHSEAPNVG